MSRTVLLQLPAPNFRWPLLDANIPLAAGYLAAWASARDSDWDILIPPWHVTDVLGDGALLSFLLADPPEVVGFSLYCWNVERSLSVARQLALAGSRIIVGGPEAEPNNPILRSADFHFDRVHGEGEEAFLRFLATGACGSRSGETQLAGLDSPYRRGHITPFPDGTLWLETVRGCPFHCSYCNYGKGSLRPRAFPPDWLEHHLQWARAQDVSEIYLMDPSFNVRPDWDRVLNILERGNADQRWRFHTELVADFLRPGDAGRLAAAGLASCELGLQSIHPQVLAAVGRKWQPRPWAGAVKELLTSGVSTSVGLILGLPGDSPAGFCSSVRYVLDEFPQADIQVFPLACLPGTQLRDQATAMGLSYLPAPPYTIQRSETFSGEALTECLHWFEETTGLESDPIDPPNLCGVWSGGEQSPYWSGIRLDLRGERFDSDRWLEEITRRAATNLTLWCTGWNAALPAWVAALIRRLPYGVLTIVLDDGAGWPPSRLGELLAGGSGRHYLDRSHRLLYGNDVRVVPRLSVLVDANHPSATDSWQAAVRTRSELIWRMEATPAAATQIRELANAGETIFVTGPVTFENLPELADDLGPECRGVIFECENTQNYWEEVSGRQGFRAPEHRVTLP